jgi:hypothetical protein
MEVKDFADLVLSCAPTGKYKLLLIDHLEAHHSL